MPHSDADPLVMLDARIRLAWARRAASPRFSEAYWDADDDLAWLRMVRDELARTGHLREELRAMVAAVPNGIEVSAELAVAVEPEPESETRISWRSELEETSPSARGVAAARGGVAPVRSDAAPVGAGSA